MMDGRVALLAAVLVASGAAQAQVKPRLLTVIDTSGSMVNHLTDNLSTGGDGTHQYLDALMSRSLSVDRNHGLYVGFKTEVGSCPGPTTPSSYDGFNSRMAVAKFGLSDALRSAGGVEWGLWGFSGSQCPIVNTLGLSLGTCTSDYSCPVYSFCIGGVCKQNMNHCVGAGAYGLTYTNSGSCVASSGVSISYSGTCSAAALSSSSTCRTPQVCYADAQCTGGGAGRCSPLPGSAARSCVCTSSAQCPASYSCVSNRCVYDVDCQVGARALVDPGPSSATAAVRWLDGVEDNNNDGTGAPVNPELHAVGPSAVASSIRAATSWYQTIKSSSLDPQITCRPYALVLLTDGSDSCEPVDGGTSTVAAAQGFVAATAPGAKQLNKVHVLALSSSAGGDPAVMNAIAAAGGTGAARFVDSRADIQAALNDIRESTVLTERCNGADDDCNNSCDESFPGVAVTNPACSNVRGAQACDNGQRPGTHCFASGAFVCSTDQLSQTCSAQTCATNPSLCPVTESCNGQDDDCNGVVDDCTPNVSGSCCASACPACAAGGPFAERCNGCDDDCDGVVDDNTLESGAQCGANVGQCTAGVVACCRETTPGAGNCSQSQLSPPSSNPNRLACIGGTQPTAVTCNGCDNNCDGARDAPAQTCYTGPAATRNIGACHDGTQSCSAVTCPSAPTFGACVGQVTPAAEVCNGKDDDCDGATDTNVTDAWAGAQCCPTGNLSDCQNSAAGTRCRTGTLSCMGGAQACTGAIAKTAELCNQVDDDCDGVVDDVTAAGNSCSGPGINTQGACRAQYQCVQGSTGPGPGGLTCRQTVGPTAESCNGLDDDCNGQTDDNPAGMGVPCGLDAGSCRAGTVTCQNGVPRCSGGIGPSAELCNGADDDCDSSTDESVIDPWAGQACCPTGNLADCQNSGTGSRCASGSYACTAGARSCVGGVARSAELCDGVDNDCNGQTDDVPGAGTSCSNGAAVSRGACVALWSCGAAPGPGPGGLTCTQVVSATAEVCNGLDDDCNGAVDDAPSGVGASCCPSGSCVGQCTAGTTACVQGALVCAGAKPGSAELCDNVDNDCDGMTDEGVVDAWAGQSCCPSGVTADCANSGGATRCSAGTWQCAGGARSCAGAVMRTAESCNAVDDDCDGAVDDVVGVGQACAGDGANTTGVCTATWSCGADGGSGPGGLRCSQARAPASELCNGQDDDCDGVIDDSPADAGEPCGAPGACQSGALTCTGGQLRCEGEVAPRAETCDGADEDCDGVVDDGASCPSGHDCVTGECVAVCATDTDCGGGTRCVNGHCAPQSCACEACQVCRGNACVDACDGKSCEAGQHCECGSCVEDLGKVSGNACGCSGAPSELGLLALFAVIARLSRRRAGLLSTLAALVILAGCGTGPVAPDAGPAAGPCTDAQLQTDPFNCGACGRACVFDHATTACAQGQCRIAACQPGFQDRDGDSANGCEARCSPSDAGESCNGADDNCDGVVDEGFDLLGDEGNCGGCGNVCSLAFASAVCTDGGCALDSCSDPSAHRDLDGVSQNGCEYACPVSPPGAEVCNGLDDDCDGVIDDSPSDVGGSCGEACPGGAASGCVGACAAGTFECQSGIKVCANDTGPSPEVCNAIDDDCDGQTDEAPSDVWAGQACCPSGQLGDCTNSDGGTRCSYGTSQCVNGERSCVGGTARTAESCNGADDDCNGAVDDVPALGAGCTGSGLNTTGVCAAAWTCAGAAGPGPSGLTCAQQLGPSVERCDGLDNDCDGTVDDSPLDAGQACGAACPGGLLANCVGECQAGVLACSAGALVCGGARGPSPEQCDNQDDDCDGVVDDNVTEPWAGQACCSTGTLADCSNTASGTRCAPGAYVCQAGARACTGSIAKSAEICNGVDDDCNGAVDDVPSVGLPCTGGGANSTGQCVAEWRCAAAPGPGPSGLTCMQITGPTSEVCDGKDNNCNGSVDDSPTDVGGSCADNCPGGLAANCVGECRTGFVICSSGAKVCSGSTGPSSEYCDGRDNDCDGTIDEGFGYPAYNSDPNNCGACNRVCNLPNAVNGCHADTAIDPTGKGVCYVNTCANTGTTGFAYVPNPGVQCGGTSPRRDGTTGIGCNYTCPVWPSAAEVCDGLDNDCDGLVDDLNSACAPGLVAPPNNCSSQGVCQGQTIPFACTGAGGWKCNYSQVPNVSLDGNGNLTPAESTCDGRDNNCNGVADLDGFPTKGQTCSAGNGACRNTGTITCASSTSVQCSATASPSNAVDELCDGVDNNCDGQVDERNPVGGATCFNGGAHACLGHRDQMVRLSATAWIYRFEASRPDSTATSAGSSSSRACSKPNALPWSTVTYAQAASACASIRDSLNQPMRLCTSAEWLAACEGLSPTLNPQWSKSSSPGVYAAQVCNDVNRTSTPAVWPTGTATGAPQFCYTDFSTATTAPAGTPPRLADLSGNVAEWTSTPVTVGGVTYYQVRGGAFSSHENATSCEFDFQVDRPDFFSPELGFRCCSTNAP